jgi:hypothetical protein
MKSFFLFAFFVLLAGICPLSSLNPFAPAGPGAPPPTLPPMEVITAVPVSSDPASATDAFFTELLAGDADIEDMLCAAAADAAEGMKEGLESMRTTLESSGATLDVSGLTFTVIEETADTATVEVAGKMSVTVSGVTQEVDFPASPVKLVLENGEWKICG